MLSRRDNDHERGIWVDRLIDSRVSGELRPSHAFIIGRAGSGKPLSMEHLCKQDIDQGHGVADIDPHADLSEGVMRRIAEKDINTISRQYRGQCKEKIRGDALCVVRITIAFNVVAEDMPRIAKFPTSRASAEELTTLAFREAIARIGNDVVRIKTPALAEVTDRSPGDRAKELSYQQYYKPVADVEESIRRRFRSSSRDRLAQSSRCRGETTPKRGSS